MTKSKNWKVKEKLERFCSDVAYKIHDTKMFGIRSL